MNLRLPRKSADDLSRRQFLLRSTCGAMGFTSLVNTLAQLKLMQGSVNAQGSTSGYKALVCVFLNGGNDSNNLLIPYSGTARTDYQNGRGALVTPVASLTATKLNPISTITRADPFGGGYLADFAVNPICGGLRDLFNAGELAFVANVGTLTQPGVTRANYATYSKPTQLFSHSDQQVQWQSSVPDKPFTSGWGGRVADLLNSAYNPSSGNASMSISISGVNSFQVSALGAVKPYVMTSAGVQSLSGYNGGTPSTTYGKALNDVTKPLFLDSNYSNTEQGNRLRAFEQIIQYANNSLMENAYSGVTLSARRTEGQVGGALSDTDISDSVTAAFNNAYANPEAGLSSTTDFTKQMMLVARLIAGNAALGNTRQIFFVQLGGFDTHTTQIPTAGNIYSTGQTGLLNTLTRTLKGFRDSLAALGYLDKVVTFSSSDFTRTFTANKTDSSAGSDHAWGGHTFVMGGPVRGGQIYGKFPPLKLGSVTGSIDATGSSGRWIPSTAVDMYAAVLANWFGVDKANLATVFPNLGRFSAAPNYSSILDYGGTANLGFLNPT